MCWKIEFFREPYKVAMERRFTDRSFHKTIHDSSLSFRFHVALFSVSVDICVRCLGSLSHEYHHTGDKAVKDTTPQGYKSFEAC